MRRKLTSKQEAFLNGLIAGKTQYQSYIDAGYATKGKSRGYIDREASVLAKNPKISQRLTEHRKNITEEIKEKAIWTKEDTLSALVWMTVKAKSEIEKKGIRDANQKAFLTSIKELNDVLGIGAEIELKIKQAQTEREDESGAASWLEALEKLANEDE